MNKLKISLLDKSDLSLQQVDAIEKLGDKEIANLSQEGKDLY